jgi:DNA-binding XRE family transcriptional regulator
MAIRKGGEEMIDLKTKREEAGLTQSQLAEKVGVIRQTISNIECGISAPSVPTAMAIGKVLDLDWKGFFEE